MNSSSETQVWLQRFIRDHGGVAGTVHTCVDPETLALTAALNIPPAVVEVVRQIPKGRGMAGLAFEHDKAITTCNLKDDNTGSVRPGAKAVEAAAAVAFPVHAVDGTVRAVVGIAYQDERDVSDADIAALTAAAASLPDK